MFVSERFTTRSDLSHVGAEGERTQGQYRMSRFHLGSCLKQTDFTWFHCDFNLKQPRMVGTCWNMFTQLCCYALKFNNTAWSINGIYIYMEYIYGIFNSQLFWELTHIIAVDQAASTAQRRSRWHGGGSKCCQVTPLELEAGSSDILPGDSLKHNRCPGNFYHDDPQSI